MASEHFIYSDERFADLQMLRYRVPGFERLTLRQQVLLYHLSEAALWGRDILWDQNCRYNLRIRRMLEAVYVQYKGERESDDFRAFDVYLKRVWFSNGIHHHYGSQKFQPAFSPTFLREAVLMCDESLLPLFPWQDVEAMMAELFPVIFDPDVLPKRVNQAEAHLGMQLLCSRRETGRSGGFLCTDESAGTRPGTPRDVRTQ